MRTRQNKRAVRRRFGMGAHLAALGAWLPLSSSLLWAAAQTFAPSADGTIADGGIYGPLDGVPDNWDYYFNDSAYEGSITLTRGVSPTALEHRVFWEFNFSSVSSTLPVTAKLTFKLRGAPRYPAEPAVVNVYAYSADLLESPQDFSSGPTTLLASKTIAPFQAPTSYTIGVSEAVSRALAADTKRIGFRFQFDPATAENTSQAFADALDSDPLTKPSLTVDTTIPGDFNGNSEVDEGDVAAFTACLTGPRVAPSATCRIFDFDLDADVDLQDFNAFQYFRSVFVP